MITDKVFETEEQRDSAVWDFKNLLANSGWHLLVTMLDSDIERIKECILTGIDLEGEKLSEERTKNLRDNLLIYQEVRNLPEKMIERLTNKETVVPEPDPFPTTEEEKKVDK